MRWQSIEEKLPPPYDYVCVATDESQGPRAFSIACWTGKEWEFTGYEYGENGFMSRDVAAWIEGNEICYWHPYPEWKDPV